MKKTLACLILSLILAGCETTLPDRAFARYERIQREVDAYYHCGERQAFDMATTALRPRDIATAAKGSCSRKRNRMLHRMQRLYASASWSRLTIDIDQTFRERAIAVVFDRRAELRAQGLPY
jgi:outer membrane PBP1 activator LpoA protein